MAKSNPFFDEATDQVAGSKTQGKNDYIQGVIRRASITIPKATT